jgi:hypothetical protein
LIDDDDFGDAGALATAQYMTFRGEFVPRAGGPNKIDIELGRHAGMSYRITAVGERLVGDGDNNPAKHITIEILVFGLSCIVILA